MDYFVCFMTHCAPDAHMWFGSEHHYEYSTEHQYCFDFVR